MLEPSKIMKHVIGSLAMVATFPNLHLIRCDMKESVGRMRDEVTGIKEDVKAVKEDVNALKKSVDELERRVGSMEGSLRTLQEGMDELLRRNKGR